MKSKIITLLWVLSCSPLTGILFGQNRSKIDSLEHLAKVAITKQEKVKAFQNISLHLIQSRVKMDVAKKYADSTTLISEGNTETNIYAKYLYAGINQNQGAYSKAMDLYNEYLNHYSKLGDSIEVARALYGIGETYNLIGEHERNMVIQNRILTIYKKENKKSDIANSLNSIGTVHSRLGNEAEAILMYEEANKIYDSLNLEISYAMGLSNIAIVHVRTKAYNKAIPLFKEGLSTTQKLNSNLHTAYFLNNLGFTYAELNQNEKALSYSLRALDIRRTLPQKKSLFHSLDNVGYSHYKLGNYDQALPYFEEALEVATKLQAKHLLMEVYEHISMLYKAKGKFEKAYSYNDLRYQMKDSIFNEKKTDQIAELQTKYETAKKDKEITLLTKENEIQEANSEKEFTLRKALIGGLISLCIIALLLFYTMRQRLRNQKIVVAKNEEINRAKLSEELRTLEMKALRAQMNPHFLFNSLNSINTMILNDEPESASRYLSKFSKLVRLMLENSEQSKVSLKDELETLEAYIQLESIRFNNKMDYKIELDAHIDKEETLLPSMVLQPFVENAIWHGLLHKNQKGLLTIEIKEKGDSLLCSIIDNGVGREKSLSLKKKGGLKKKSMGIKITTDRLKLLTKQKIKEVINIIDLKDNNNNALGTQVNIQIPLS